MPSLKEILDDLDIKTDDLEKKTEGEVDLSTVKLDDIPEAQRPVFQKMMSVVEEAKTELARRDIVIGTLRESINKKEPENKTETQSQEKILGVLDPTDPYAPAFKALADMVGGIKKSKEVDEEEEFKTQVIEFAKDHKDIVRYIKPMEKLMQKHPTLAGDIPTLYKLAKDSAERRDKASKDKKDELDRASGAEKFRTESSGTSSGRVTSITNAKSISEAFDASEKQLARR